MTRDPYDRLPEESSKAHEAFALYRDMGTNRSTHAVAQQLGKSIAIIQRWSSLYAWVARATAYDDHIEAEARKKLERDAIRRKADMLKRHASTGRALQSKGLEYLQASGIDKSSDAISAIKSGVDMERKAEGLPEWIFEIVNADDDELARQYTRLLAEIGGDQSGDETPGDQPPDASPE